MRQEHEEECVSWKHSLRSVFASLLKQRPDRYREELWRNSAVHRMHGGTASRGNGEHGFRVGRVHLDAMGLKVDANAAIGIMGKQGLGNVSHLDLSFLWLQSAVRGKQVNLKKVQAESNMSDLGTKVLEKDQIDRHMKNLGCVQFDQ